MASFWNNPHEILNERIELNSDDIETKILTVISQIVHKDLNDSNLNYRVVHLSGGNTNILYRVYSDDLNQEQYVIRLYGIGTEDFIDRSVENLIFSELSKSGISPPFVGLFQNGRVEGFLNARSLSPDEFPLPPIARSIAKALANFQMTTINNIDKSVGLWNKLGVFFKLAQENIDTNHVPKFTSSGIDFSKVTLESQWIHSALETLRISLFNHEELSDFMRGEKFAFESVLCHNDVLSGNVLLEGSVDDPKITLIDYEYSGYNYRGFDIANHFCEYAGFEFDIRNKFPSESTRKEFLRQFILQTHELRQRESSSSSSSYSSNSLLVGDTISEDFLNGVDTAVMKFVLVSHLYWGSWAVIQAAHSLIDFDFLEYAGKRFDGYFYHKDMIQF